MHCGLWRAARTAVARNLFDRFALLCQVPPVAPDSIPVGSVETFRRSIARIQLLGRL